MPQPLSQPRPILVALFVYLFIYFFAGCGGAAADREGGANAGGRQQATGSLLSAGAGTGGLQEPADLQRPHPGPAEPAAEDEESPDPAESGTQVR